MTAILLDYAWNAAFSGHEYHRFEQSVSTSERSMLKPGPIDSAGSGIPGVPSITSSHYPSTYPRENVVARPFAGRITSIIFPEDLVESTPRFLWPKARTIRATWCAGWREKAFVRLHVLLCLRTCCSLRFMLSLLFVTPGLISSATKGWSRVSAFIQASQQSHIKFSVDATKTWIRRAAVGLRGISLQW